MFCVHITHRGLLTASTGIRWKNSLPLKWQFYQVWCVIRCNALSVSTYLGRIWWKLQSHNSIFKMYFLACAYWVVLITDQFWIKWFFGKKVIFWPKKAFFGKKWLFDPLDSAGQQSCFRTFCLGANFLPFYEKKNSGTFRQNISDQFFHFYPHIFGHISWILVNK